MRTRPNWLNASNGWPGIMIRTYRPLNMLRVTRIIMAFYTPLSRLATCTLTQRLNGPCIGTFAKKCTCLASNWTQKRWPITKWKPDFTANCTCMIICARISRNWPHESGRGIRTTGNKKPHPANRVRRSKYRGGRYG